MTTTTTIPLNKLLAWDGNVRKTEADKNIVEPAASITAHGLLQSRYAHTSESPCQAFLTARKKDAPFAE